MDKFAAPQSPLPEFLIGNVAGLRSATAPAVVAWAAHRDAIRLQGSPVSFMASSAAVAALTLFALAELVVDKLPATPDRTAPTGLIARAVLGGLSGAAVAIAARRSGAVGALLGAAGGITGAYAGHRLRTRLAARAPDLALASLEDAAAIVGARSIVSRL